MVLRKWEQLPKYMRTEAVRPYYNSLKKKKYGLLAKRIFDFVIALIMLVILIPVFVVIAILIAKDSQGGIFYRQERVTQYGKKFRIFKFRTMVANADQIGSQVTVNNDTRVTKIGRILRKYRLDELPQLINIVLGDMSFVGTRPESSYYVKKYSSEMFATLLLPAGVTSEASILYKDEAELLEIAEDVDEVYVKKVLPEKMKYNLNYIKKYSFLADIKLLIKTLVVIM